MIDLYTHVVPLSTPFLDRLATGNPRWARLASAGTTGDVLGAGKLFPKWSSCPTRRTRDGS